MDVKSQTAHDMERQKHDKKLDTEPLKKMQTKRALSNRADTFQLSETAAPAKTAWLQYIVVAQQDFRESLARSAKTESSGKSRPYMLSRKPCRAVESAL